jgi:UDP-N-acetylmuramate dehydrogenase
MMSAGARSDSSQSFAYPLERPEFDNFRSRLRQGADLSKSNWFRVGGPAQWLFRPEHSNDLAGFLALLPHEVPVTVLGVGSNLIVRDGGLDGVVIRLGRGFTQITTQGQQVTAGAAALSLNAALVACEKGISGLEFLSGIPGTIGGAVWMNAGAYGSDTSQVLVEAEIVERSGKVRRLTREEIGFSYRHSNLPEGAIVTQAVFKGGTGDRYEISKTIQDISSSREATQPIRSRTGGSTFKNPPENISGGHKAWELIDKAGCRGLTMGGAQVSEKHCNFLINTGEATAKDLEGLGEEVIRRVRDKTGITLEWEIKRLGKAV